MSKKMWIIIGIVLFLLIIFFVWKSYNDRKLAAQAERDRLYQTYGPAAPTTATTANTGGGAAATINSLQGLIDSLASAFGKNPSGSDDSAAALRMFENQCESLHNDPISVGQCVESKMIAAGYV